MSGAHDFVGKAHAVNSGVFAFGWTMLFLVSDRLLGGVLPIWGLLVGALAAVLLGAIGLHPGERYFLIGAPERWVKTCRSGGIVLLRSWVIQGDRMNAFLRARFPSYRGISRGAIEAYILRSHDMERIHLACLLASVVVFALAALGSLWALAGSLLAATLVTNILPIILQRFNRARCQLVLQRRKIWSKR
ncbi:MAG TPA: hypothetical protein VIM71_05460 [Lacunisphaera sp.]